MLKNRSAPHAIITPVLIVRDVREAVTWYGTVFGFVEHVQIGEGHRAQLGLGGCELVVAEQRPGGRRAPIETRSHQIMLKVEDAAVVVARATANGATLVDKLNDWEYGERQATIADVFGHHWVLTQTLVDVAPEQWGGKTITPRG